VYAESFTVVELIFILFRRIDEREAFNLVNNWTMDIIKQLFNYVQLCPLFTMDRIKQLLFNYVYC
jgi:hypothetical protein